MSWIVVGDRDYATFACDTGMEGFGPLHGNYGVGSAKKELQEFAELLDADPRTLHNRGTLQEKYNAWKISEG